MFASSEKSRTFASLLKQETSGVQLSWFRASALQAEGRRFESVNAHQSFRVSWLKKEFRAFSSAGSEHLPYKQRVGGSNPSTPTEILKTFTSFRAFSSAGSEHLPYKQRVGGSNPSTPTENIAEWSSWQLVGLITQRSSVRVRPPQLGRRSKCFSFFISFC